MSGAWVFVCGPSGAGKDSVINWAAQYLATRQNISFSRRVVTRAVSEGSDHDAVTPQQFEHLRRAQRLAWQWDAHGFQYGIESRYAVQVAAGEVVVVNGSREHATRLETSSQVRVVHITADSAALAARLMQRGREGLDKIAQRLQRNAIFGALSVDHTIVNTGALAQAGQQLSDYLEAVASLAMPSSNL